MLQDKPVVSEQPFREAIAFFHRIGDVGSLSSVAPLLPDQDAARSTR
jgi:hypothetical protein